MPGASGYVPPPLSEHADAGFDDHAARMLRNEERLTALTALLQITRTADRELLEQRAMSLAGEMESARAALQALLNEERSADSREVHARIDALEDRRIAATELLAQRIADQHRADEIARAKEHEEVQRRLIVLNHEHERTATVLANSVTREVFQAEKEATQGLIGQLDRAMLGMTPRAESERVHAEIVARSESAQAAAALTLDTKIEVVKEQIAELKTAMDRAAGRGQGYSMLYGWLIAGVGLLISVIIVANTLIGR